jgi:hypothetical protein
MSYEQDPPLIGVKENRSRIHRLARAILRSPFFFFFFFSGD